HIGLGLQASSFQRQAKRFHEGISRVADGANDGICLNAFSGFQQDAARRDFTRVHMQADINSARTQFSHSKLREEFGVQFWKNSVTALQKNDPDTFPVKLGIKRQSAREQIVDGARPLHAAETAANYNNGEQSPALHGIGFDRSFFQTTDQ